jgi:hypothetical protein
MKNILLATFISVTLLACGNNETGQDLSLIPDKKASTVSDNQSINKTAAQNSGAPNLPQQVPIGTNVNLQQPPASMPQNIVADNKTGAAVNPPHGQPGHVCGTPAAGATTTTTVPQNVQAKTSAPQQMAIPQQVNNIKPAITSNTANGKLNPAHGQPGHRCDIPAGAPLNSSPQKSTAPKAVTTNTVTTAPIIANPSTMPALQPTEAVQTNNAANGAPPLISNGSSTKLNPEHGKPGHDCKVAVGQPLPNK